MEKLFYDLYDFAIGLAPDDDYMENFPDLKERFERIKNEQFLGKTSLEMVVSFLEDWFPDSWDKSEQINLMAIMDEAKKYITNEDANKRRIKHVKKIVYETIYIAEDGTEFKDEHDCSYYEMEKRQLDAEKKVDDLLGIKLTNTSYPTMLSSYPAFEFRYFLIKNEQDLNLFIEVYEYWFSKLEKYPQVNKETFSYPDVLCIVDFPKGGDEYRLYRINQLCNQFNAFVDELNFVVEKKYNEVSQNNIN